MLPLLLGLSYITFLCAIVEITAYLRDVQPGQGESLIASPLVSRKHEEEEVGPTLFTDEDCLRFWCRA